MIALILILVLVTHDISCGQTLIESNQQHQQQQQQQQQRNQSNQAMSKSKLEFIAIDGHYPDHEDESGKLSSLSSSIRKAYMRANSMRAYHTDLHSYRDEHEFSGDPKWIDSRDKRAQQKCLDDLNIYNNLIQSYHEHNPISDQIISEAHVLADTFGRPEAALLDGNQFWLGDYKACNNFIYSNVSTQPIKSQYCLGISSFPNWSPSDSKHAIKIGLCMPESCTTFMLNQVDEIRSLLENVVEKFIPVSGPMSHIRLNEVYCLPHESSQARQLSTSGLILVTLLGALLASAILATILDIFNGNLLGTLNPNNKPSQKEILIESFSILRNLRKVFSVRSQQESSKNGDKNKRLDSKDTGILKEAGKDFDKNVFFNSMAGIKCIGLIWIITAHTYLMSPILSSSMSDVDRLTKTYLSDVYQAAHLLVDTFFALMGMITSFLIFSEGIEKLRLKHWIVITVHRYWRLTPIYLICYWFAKSLGSRVNNGPMWDFGTSESSPRVECERESWLSAILLLSDFKSPKKHCVPFAWFLGNGFKFWLITPFLLIQMSQSIRRGYTIVLTLLIANIALVYHLANNTHVDVKSVIDFKPEAADNMLNNMEEIYTRPYSRVGAYLVGLLMGHIFYLEQIGKLRLVASREFTRIAWTLFAIITLGLIFLLKILKHLGMNEETMRDSFSLGSAFVRPVWAACTCWLMFALSHGHVPWLTKFLTAKFWRIFVKCSFCAYLAQGEVIANVFLSATTIARGTPYLDLISRPILVIILTTMTSFFMVIFIEYPLTEIEKLFLPDKSAFRAQTKKESQPREATQTPDHAKIE